MAHSVAHSLHEQNDESREEEERGRKEEGGGGREEGKGGGGKGGRREGREEGREGGGKGGRRGREGPTQYIWIVFEPPCHLLPEHGEMVLHLLFVVIETLPVCVWEGGGEWEEDFRLEMDNKVQLVRADHVFPTASQK